MLSSYPVYRSRHLYSISSIDFRSKLNILFCVFYFCFDNVLTGGCNWWWHCIPSCAQRTQEPITMILQSIRVKPEDKVLLGSCSSRTTTATLTMLRDLQGYSLEVRAKCYRRSNYVRHISNSQPMRYCSVFADYIFQNRKSF